MFIRWKNVGALRPERNEDTWVFRLGEIKVQLLIIIIGTELIADHGRQRQIDVDFWAQDTIFNVNYVNCVNLQTRIFCHTE